jgi:pyruvate dehydrogenase E2 component (dihydrolipoyllysine-residue acetyltransferase)
VYLKFEVIIPSFGSPGDEVRLEEWLVQPGDFIKAGAPFFVVTTDKATVEVEAYRDGYVQEIIAQPGSSIPVGSVVAILRVDEGEDQTGEPTFDINDAPLGLSFHGQINGSVELDSQNSDEQKILASPLAKRMAREAGISLVGVRGSGREGQVKKRDVEQLIARGQVQAAVRNDFAPKATRLPLSGLRRSIADRTQQSKAEAPHFYATKIIDMTEARSALSQLARYAESNHLLSPTINDLILKATALALRKTPGINASLHQDEILFFEDVNIGLVVGLEEGMIIPVIRQADRMSLFKIATESNRLKEEARQGHLKSSDLLGSTFTLSNLGMYGLDSFTAVINPPEAGILAVGAIKQVMAVWKGEAAPRWQMTATLSVDHRLVDGITAANFVQELQLGLENPIYLTIETPK